MRKRADKECSALFEDIARKEPVTADGKHLALPILTGRSDTFRCSNGHDLIDHIHRMLIVGRQYDITVLMLHDPDTAADRQRNAAVVGIHDKANGIVTIN